MHGIFCLFSFSDQLWVVLLGKFNKCTMTIQGTKEGKKDYIWCRNEGLMQGFVQET
jgi:hypothetical protein